VVSVMCYQLGIAMLTVLYDLPRGFRETCLIDLDLYSWLLVLQGPVSFWADVIDSFVMFYSRGYGHMIDGIMAPTLTILAIFGSLYWGPILTNHELNLSFSLILGPIIFVLNRLCGENYPSKFIWHILWHLSMPVIGGVLLTTIKFSDPGSKLSSSTS